MKLAVASHQIGTSYLKSKLGPSDEPDTPLITDDEPLDAIAGIYGKAFDGLSFMSRFDRHSRSIASLAVIEARDAEHRLFGREWTPWGNVRGSDPEYKLSVEAYSAAEGKLAAEVAIAGAGPNEPAVCILNVEPYAQFWIPRGDESLRAIYSLVESFKRNGGEEIWLWIDARKHHTEAIDLAYWLEQEVVTRILPETYWTDFGKSPTETLSNAITVLDGYGVDASRIYPSFPGDSTGDDMNIGLQWAHQLGMGRPNVWQRMNFSPEAALAVARFPDLWAGETEAEAPNTFTLKEVDILLETGIKAGASLVTRQILDLKARTLEPYNHIDDETLSGLVDVIITDSQT